MNEVCLAFAHSLEPLWVVFAIMAGINLAVSLLTKVIPPSRAMLAVRERPPGRRVTPRFDLLFGPL